MSKGGPVGGARARRTGGRARRHTTVAVVLALQLAIGLLVVGGDGGTGPAPGAVAADAGVVEHDRTPRAVRAAPAASSTPATAAAPLAASSPAGPAPEQPAAGDPAPSSADAAGPLVVPDPGPDPEPSALQAAAGAPATTVAASAPASQSQSEQLFAREYPAHAAASQRADEPSSFHWAVIIGVNDYMGRTTNTIGSVGDAQVLRDTLYREGWRGDQVLTLTDREATHDRVVRAIEWLIRSTDHRSTVVFSFSGHMRHNAGTTALWPADNRFIWAGDLGRMLGAVQADRMWVGLNGCHAAGLAAPGLEGPNRVVTYASTVQGKAYEDPAVGHSVMGYYMYAEGLRDRRGSVQEAFGWAAPRATTRTTGQQPYGAQHPVIADGLGGRAFPLAVTGAPRGPDAPAAPGAPAGDAEESDSRGLLPRLVGNRVPSLLN